jgi:hypothetical protein
MVIGLQGERISGQLRTQGDIMAQQGEVAQQAGYYGAGSTLLQGVSNVYTRYNYKTDSAGNIITPKIGEKS